MLKNFPVKHTYSVLLISLKMMLKYSNAKILSGALDSELLKCFCLIFMMAAMVAILKFFKLHLLPKRKLV